MQVKVAACQLLSGESVSENTADVLKQLASCAAMGVQIVAFPEGCLFGYTCRADYWEQMSPATFEAAEAEIASACRRHRIAAIVGSAHHDGSNWHNDLAIIDEQGHLKYRYGKTFLAGEKWCINNRGKLPIVPLAGVDCCFLICHDIRYPELVRLPAAMGAQICFFCSCESGLTSEYKLSAYRAMPISRATESHIYLVMANTPADPDNLRRSGNSHGNSKIVHPDGNVIQEAGFFGDAIVAATVDISAATGGPAKRVYHEETALRDWFREGCRYVVRVE